MVRDVISKAKPKFLSPAANSNYDTRATSSGLDFPIPNFSEKARLKKLHQPLNQTSEQALPVLQTERRHYSRAAGYRTFRISNFSTRYRETLSSYSSQRVKKIESQMKKYFFDSSDPLLSLATSIHLHWRVTPAASNKAQQCGLSHSSIRALLS